MNGLFPKIRRRSRDNLLDFIDAPAEFLDEIFGISEIEIPKMFWSIPMINTRDVEDGIEIELAAPGLKKSDFDLDLSGKKLTISAERKETTEEEDENEYKRREFNYSSFTRTINLPGNASTDEISAKYEGGLLIVSVPFEEKSDRTKVEVE